MECVIAGCTRRMRYTGKGWCQTHYHRWYRNGDPLIVKAPKERECYKGDDVEYRAAHSRIVTARGKASEHECTMCYDQAEHWAYDHQDPNEKIGSANGCELPFSPNPDHYLPMCRPCHREFDKQQERS